MPRLLIFLAVSIAFAAPARAGDATALLAELRGAYAGVHDLRARFRQTSELVALGTERTAEGTVAFTRGGRMRWSYEGDDPQTIVSDGETLWIHQVRDRTVIRQPLASLPASSRAALDLLGGFDAVEKQFEPSSCGERCLVLSPRTPQPDLVKLTVELAPGGPGIRAVASEDPLGNRTRVEFLDVRVDGGVAPDTFVFTPPAGTRVVDGGGAFQ